MIYILEQRYTVGRTDVKRTYTTDKLQAHKWKRRKKYKNEVREVHEVNKQSIL
jgi:hypothetical protein